MGDWDGAVALIADSGKSTSRLADELSEFGYRVRRADCLRAGLDVLRCERPAIAATELRLDGGSGIELLRYASMHSPQTRVIVATMYGSLSSAHTALSLGAAGFLCKPVTGVQLLAAAKLLPTSAVACSNAARLSLKDARREYIESVLELCGSVSAAARALGVDRRSLRRMLSSVDRAPVRE